MRLIKNNYKSKELCFLFFAFIFFITATNIYGQERDCPNDFDCDAIIDAFDVDDDNDGIYDHIESPTCFYLDKTIHETGDRRSMVDVSTTLTYSSGPIDLLIDGISIVTNGINIAGYTSFKDMEIVRLTSKFSAGIAYSSITFHLNAVNFFNRNKVVLQGSQDGVIWTDLTEKTAPNNAVVVTIPVTQNLGYYKIYRLMGISGVSGGFVAINEITCTIGEYIPSLYPKTICDGEDFDRDGQPNHQDWDADGDFCNDVLEAGFQDPDRDGMLGSGSVIVDQYGAVTSDRGYITANNLYYLDATMNVCAVDGIPVDENSHCLSINTIANDYGLIQSIYHSSIVRTKTGFAVFGEYATASGRDHVTSPTDIIPDNGYKYEGTILAATLGGVGGTIQPNQFFVLSTVGLYTWGRKGGTCIPDSWTTSGAFQKINLPVGILPSMIKYMTANFGSLALLTKSGDVYVAGNFPEVYGDGSIIKDGLWHKSDIGNVKSIKINGRGQAMALTQQGELYTWGPDVLLGNGIKGQDLLRPTKMTSPIATTGVKMIAFSFGGIATYYVLGNDKRVYSLGGNADGQLGIGSATNQLSWQIVKNAVGNGYLENIKFINATHHDSTRGAVGAITRTGILYLWGKNDKNRLGISGLSVYLPSMPRGITRAANDIIYVELGGGGTPVIDEKLGEFGYVGDKINGSMGVPSSGSNLDSYDFIDTPLIDFCNLITGGRKATEILINPMNINSKPDKE
ncbi:hypothetical protein OIU80_20295 [Flavobacterium sp. LS1R47]|uniref:Uncharacterized protein n=1 Tax=Flavobacterium frigoritolerans TaxID=2987686 RepID=A0A9X3CAF7_9FLAO|nr:hypothetical protein [Flavobacterium frigoritolerans]MCV9934630.1 hypothetical protein [Flavobacterium frigoritolerans]